MPNTHTLNFKIHKNLQMDGGVNFDTLANNNKSHADGVFILAIKCSIWVWLLKWKHFAGESGLFQKDMTYKLCQNANFKNGGTTIQISTLHVLLNMLPIS